MAWLNSLSTEQVESLCQAPLHSQLGAVRHSRATLSQKELVPQRHLVSAHFLIPVSSDCFGPCPHAVARLAKDCQHQMLQN